MTSQRVAKKIPASLLLAGFAGLMSLCWWGGREAGKIRGARSLIISAGASVPAAGPFIKTTTSADADTVTPESTAALLKRTLDGFHEYEKIPPNTFNGHWRRAKLISDLTRLGTPQLLALVDALMAEGSKEAEEMAGRILGPVLTARDPARVWQWLRAGAATGNPVYERFLSGIQSIFTEWALRDAKTAMAAWDAEVKPLMESGKIAKFPPAELYRCWALSDPAAALDAVEKLSDPADRLQVAAITGISFGKLFKGEPSTWSPDADALVNRLLAIGGDSARPGMEEIMRARLARQTPEEAAVWVEKLQASPEQRAFLDKTIADPWMARDPAAAASWYVDRVSARDPDGRSAALERSIRHWTRVGDNSVERDNQQPPDLAAASEWLIAQGLNTQSQAAMATLARAWGEAREPEAALAWARALPEESARAEAINAVTKEIRQRFPNDWQRLTQDPQPPETPAK